MPTKTAVKSEYVKIRRATLDFVISELRDIAAKDKDGESYAHALGVCNAIAKRILIEIEVALLPEVR